ncbi:MAG: hypothetical protein FWH20_07085 [Oscillospiraceae bacterium]|nr:hypothetical protein [Oscillospiraceae bacterium]
MKKYPKFLRIFALFALFAISAGLLLGGCTSENGAGSATGEPPVNTRPDLTEPRGESGSEPAATPATPANPDSNSNGDSGNAPLEKTPPANSPIDSNHPLIGKWEFASGDVLHYFMQSDEIEFFGNGSVIESGYSEKGKWTVTGDSSFSVVGEYNPDTVFTFDFRISGDVLTIIDEDGDTADWRVPGTGPAPAVVAPPPGNLTGDDGSLVGRWEFTSGDSVYFFLDDCDIEFFESGYVYEYGFMEVGGYDLIGGNRFTVQGDYEGEVYLFEYEIRGENLSVTDEAGDTAVYKRIHYGDPADSYVTQGHPLVGRWEFASGVEIWFFMAYDYIEFFGDGLVFEYGHSGEGQWAVVDRTRIGVHDGSYIYFFQYEINGDRLTITDEDGDTAVWTKAARV